MYNFILATRNPAEDEKKNQIIILCRNANADNFKHAYWINDTFAKIAAKQLSQTDTETFVLQNKISS